MKFKYNDKEVEVTEEMLVDKMELLVEVENYGEAVADIQSLEGSNTLTVKNGQTTCKLNVGKEKDGFNIGATPAEVKEEIDMLDSIDINVISNHQIEYCLNVMIDFDPMKENRFWNDVYNMLITKKYRSSTVGLANKGSISRNGNVSKDNTTNVKGFKTGMTCKIYDKFHEKKGKGKLEVEDGLFMLRMEISLNKEGLKRSKVTGVTDTARVKKLFIEYIEQIRTESGKKKTRWNSRTHQICDKFLACVNK